MEPVKKQTGKTVEPGGKKWYEADRYKNHLPPEKTHFPVKVAKMNEILAKVKWKDNPSSK